MAEIEITGENRIMLEELASRATTLYDELRKINSEISNSQKRAQEIQVEIYGISSTAKFLMTRLAKGQKYEFDSKTFKITVQEDNNNGKSPEQPPQS